MYDMDEHPFLLLHACSVSGIMIGIRKTVSGVFCMNIANADMQWEKKLNIISHASKYEKDDKNHSRYEPTPYPVLERLCGSGLITDTDLLLDYGSGRGRVSFYVSYVTGCESVGVEYDPSLCKAAHENLLKFSGKHGKIRFVCENAEDYAVADANRFYFFNPFSVGILKSVLGRIYEGYYENPRQIYLFFYYALDTYVSELMSDPNLKYEREIDVRDLFHNSDEKERILIFSVGSH